VEVTVADLTATSVFSTNRVYRCTSSHTSSGTFLADKATRWTLVSDANFFTSDVSYGTRNGVYLDGVAGALVTRCWIFDHIYAGLNIGSGPVQAVNAGPGADFVSVQANNIYGNGNGIAGGKMRYVNIDGNTVRDNITYQIVSDTGSAQVSVTGNNVKGGASHGIFFYNVNYGTISGNTVAGAGGVGILLDNSSAITAVQGNSVNACLQGIRVYNTPVGTIAGNAVNGNTQHGIAVELASQTALQGNVSQGNGFDGIRITSCSAFSITGNVCSLNVGQAGIYLDGCSLGTVTGNVTFDNNNTGSPPTDGAGIRLHNSASTTVVANQSYDSRASGLKTQRYGVRSTGTSDANTLGANRLSGNAVADYLLTGTANRVTVDTANVTSATTPGNFTASNVLSFVQPDGTIAYVPCRLSAW
jgi:parallel beta-helix repeat protein